MAPPSLPDELWIAVFRDIDSSTLWLGVREVNKQFRACAEDIAQSHILKQFEITINYTLGSGVQHRWYDIRGGITLSFQEMSRLNPQYALFEKRQMHPINCQNQAWERWHQMCAAGFGSEQEWRVQMEGNETHNFRLPSLVVSDRHGLFVDWREMLTGYFNEFRRINPVFSWL